MVAKSLPIASGYPAHHNQKLSAFGQSDRSIYGRGSRQQWQGNSSSDVFGNSGSQGQNVLQGSIGQQNVLQGSMGSQGQVLQGSTSQSMSKQEGQVQQF